MAAIGSFGVTTFQGFMFPASIKSAILESDTGTDGVGVVFGGWAAGICEITTHVDAANVAAAIVLRDQYLAASKTVVDVVDQYGTVWPYTTVIGVRIIHPRTVTSGCRVSAVWGLLPQTQRPPGVEAGSEP